MFYNSEAIGKDYRLEIQNRINSNREERRVNEQNEYLSFSEKKYELRKLREEYELFQNNTKDYLVSEGINYIVSKVVKAITENNTNITMNNILPICKSTVINFVRENGADNIVDDICTKTLFLNEFSEILCETYSNIMEKCNPEDKTTFCIKNSDNDKFYRSLDTLNGDQMSERIGKRVSMAIDNFIQNNVNDKLDMEELAEKIKEKADKYKNKDEVAQEFTKIYKGTILEKQEGRNKNILESMINKMTRTILTDEELKTSYVNESGKLDTSSIIETAIGMYAVLETLNSLRFKEANADYISEVLSGIN